MWEFTVFSLSFVFGTFSKTTGSSPSSGHSLWNQHWTSSSLPTSCIPSRDTMGGHLSDHDITMLQMISSLSPPSAGRWSGRAFIKHASHFWGSVSWGHSWFLHQSHDTLKLKGLYQSDCLLNCCGQGWEPAAPSEAEAPLLPTVEVLGDHFYSQFNHQEGLPNSPFEWYHLVSVEIMGCCV